MLHHLLMWPLLYLVQDGEQRPRPGLHMQMVWGRRAARRPIVERPVSLSQRRSQVEQRSVTAGNGLWSMGACSDDQMVGQDGERVGENNGMLRGGQPPLLPRQMLGTQKTAPGTDRRGVDRRCSADKTLRIVLCNHLRAVDLQRPILRGCQRHCTGA